MYKNYKSFDYEQFKKEFSYGDLSGLEYIETTIIKEIKDYLDGIDYLKQVDFTIEEYIYDLFKATLNLNYCNNIYETSSYDLKINFNYDIYANIRDKLFEELGFDLEDIWNYVNNFR